MKGATDFDKLCHRIFDAEAHSMDYLSRDTHIRCRICGFSLCAYYCEERLYLVECEHCHKKALVKAGNPKIAAYETFGEEGTVKCV